MKEQQSDMTLSPWWRRSVILVFVCGMAVLIFMSVQAYRYAPPIPKHVVDTSGKIIFSGTDIEAGQQVFLKYALMQNGSIWGHGSYLGPDFSAQYLHELSIDTGKAIAEKEGIDLSSLNTEQQHSLIDARVAGLLKENRYDPVSKELTFTDPEKVSYQRQLRVWSDYFLHPEDKCGAADQIHPRPRGDSSADGFFCLDCLGQCRQTPGQILFVYQQFSL